ncbi:UNVERIFIED_CONTAM: hypothetical protein GTU68_020147 [Idotea baltica]|nr:hypothetical protein [Idotea baltica]
MKIVFATHNLNKLKEVQQEVQQLMPDNIKLLSLSDINCNEEIIETEDTLLGNAQLKANYITKTFGYDCFADDTGLEVIALNGAPGVYSARYAGPLNDANANMTKLLTNLRDSKDRTAQFKTVIVLNLKENQHVFEGICKGEILKNRQGKDGFGYDPIFKPVGFDSSFAEMTLEEKGVISHRGKAIAKLVAYLSS